MAALVGVLEFPEMVGIQGRAQSVSPVRADI
jgi:hypothetical protein